MYKRLFLSSLTLALITTFTASALDIPKAKTNTYVYDAANVISDEVETDLNNKLRSLEQQTSAELFIVTLNGLEGSSIEDVGYDIGNDMGIGQKEHDNGLLLLISPPEGRQNVRIEVGRGMEGIFNDAKAGRILDQDFVPYRETGDYQTAIQKTTETLITETANNAEWVGKPTETELLELLPTLAIILITLLFVFIPVLISAYHMGKKSATKDHKNLKFWAILALGFAIMNKNNQNRRNRWGGHGSFGGFGGGDGGWSGGGSGGGSFGGGGASR